VLYQIIEFEYWGLPIYNIMVAIGGLFATLILIDKQKKANTEPKVAEKVNLSFLLAGFSSLIVSNVINWFIFPETLGYPLLQRIAISGLSFYYGMFGFFAISIILLKIQKQDWKFWINEIIPSVLILHAFGRIGCSLAGCCYGVLLTNTLLERFPAREIEMICLIIMFFVFNYIIKNNRLFYYLLSYSIIRFFIEFGRGDNRGALITEILSPAQITSIIIWISLITFSLLKVKNTKKYL